MKISEMNNDQALDTLIRISTPFENLCNDDEVVEALEKLGGMVNQPPIRIFGMMIPLITTVGFKKHKQDLYEIVSALTATPVSKIGQMNFKETLKAIQDSYDDVIRDFFTSSAIARRIAAQK